MKMTTWISLGRGLHSAGCTDGLYGVQGTRGKWEALFTTYADSSKPAWHAKDFRRKVDAQRACEQHAVERTN